MTSLILSFKFLETKHRVNINKNVFHLDEMIRKRKLSDKYSKILEKKLFKNGLIIS